MRECSEHRWDLQSLFKLLCTAVIIATVWGLYWMHATFPIPLGSHYRLPLYNWQAERTCLGVLDSASSSSCASTRPPSLASRSTGPSPAQLWKYNRQSQKIPTVEGLYCKMPIQCLASSKILIPHPPTARRVCTPPSACGAGGGHTRWGERGWGFNILEDARHCSVLYMCKHFVIPTYWKKKQIHNVVFESCFQIGDHRPRKEGCFCTLHRASHVLSSLRDTNQKEIFSLPLNSLVWSFLKLSHCYFFTEGSTFLDIFISHGTTVNIVLKGTAQTYLNDRTVVVSSINFLFLVFLYNFWRARVCHVHSFAYVAHFVFWEMSEFEPKELP